MHSSRSQVLDAKEEALYGEASTKRTHPDTRSQSSSACGLPLPERIPHSNLFSLATSPPTEEQTKHSAIPSSLMIGLPFLPGSSDMPPTHPIKAVLPILMPNQALHDATWSFILPPWFRYHCCLTIQHSMNMSMLHCGVGGPCHKRKELVRLNKFRLWKSQSLEITRSLPTPYPFLYRLWNMLPQHTSEKTMAVSHVGKTPGVLQSLTNLSI